VTVSPYEVIVPAGFVWQKPAVIDDWQDGDSAFCHVRIGTDDEQHRVEVRIEGINAVELRTTFGKEALAAARGFAPSGTQVMLVEHKREKYGRMLAKMILPDGSDLGTRMLLSVASDGVTPLAVPYLT